MTAQEPLPPTWFRSGRAEVKRSRTASAGFSAAGISRCTGHFDSAKRSTRTSGSFPRKHHPRERRPARTFEAGCKRRTLETHLPCRAQPGILLLPVVLRGCGPRDTDLNAAVRERGAPTPLRGENTWCRRYRVPVAIQAPAARIIGVRPARNRLGTHAILVTRTSFQGGRSGAFRGPIPDCAPSRGTIVTSRIGDEPYRRQCTSRRAVLRFSRMAVGL